MGTNTDPGTAIVRTETSSLPTEVSAETFFTILIPLGGILTLSIYVWLSFSVGTHSSGEFVGASPSSFTEEDRDGPNLGSSAAGSFLDVVKELTAPQPPSKTERDCDVYEDDELIITVCDKP